MVFDDVKIKIFFFKNFDFIVVLYVYIYFELLWWI